MLFTPYSTIALFHRSRSPRLQSAGYLPLVWCHAYDRMCLLLLLGPWATPHEIHSRPTSAKKIPHHRVREEVLIVAMSPPFTTDLIMSATLVTTTLFKQRIEQYLGHTTQYTNNKPCRSRNFLGPGLPDRLNEATGRATKLEGQLPVCILTFVMFKLTYPHCGIPRRIAPYRCASGQ